ncbi:hypothetical protein AURDEDRAFT_127803 [Auricularia subglabra TFB-10046 SS5]|uniref:Uncharacterized protein n=1 Tax=Auricularia subglabra (strain TFB-10046 / SS5) TaxID=717982 RepID=J0WWC3_AURST|nr:hypothetical protein AURDEDRAFT_127803 [Auricularia subglabra TFB-10046 SS5]
MSTIAQSQHPISAVLRRFSVAAPVAASSFICLDPKVDDKLWATVLEECTTAAHILGVDHFMTHALDAKPYTSAQDAAPSKHLHHLHLLCHKIKQKHNCWPQFIVAVVPDLEARHVVQYTASLSNASAAIGFSKTSQTAASTSWPRRSRVSLNTHSFHVRLNMKLGGFNSLPRNPYVAPLLHTLILGGAISYAHCASVHAWHSGLAGCLDDRRHRWFTELSYQIGISCCVLDLEVMLERLLECVGEPVNRVLFIRGPVPPYELEYTVKYGSHLLILPPHSRLFPLVEERKCIDRLFTRRTGAPPALAIVVPWTDDDDASTAEDYNKFQVHSQTFAIPVNEFGSGWDIDALRQYVASFTYDFAYDNAPTVYPAPLNYANAIADSIQMHFAEGAPASPRRAVQEYKHVPRHASRLPFWL